MIKLNVCSSIDNRQLQNCALEIGEKLTTTWDEDKLFACVCDSPTWEVGLENGQRQLAEYYGPDCSLRRGPSGVNPLTARDETICGNYKDNGGSNYGATGAKGNLCHIECSNHGIAQADTGNCVCLYNRVCSVYPPSDVLPPRGIPPGSCKQWISPPKDPHLKRSPLTIDPSPGSPKYWISAA